MNLKMDQQETSNMKEKKIEEKMMNKFPGATIPKDKRDIHVTTAEERRNSEVGGKKSGKAKNVCRPVNDIGIKIRTLSRKGRLSETQAMLSQNQTLHTA